MDMLRGGWGPGMLGNGTAGAGSPYSSEAQAIFAAFTTPPTDPRKALIDACVVSLKTGGVWTKLDELQVHAAADNQAAKINWKQPGTYNSTEVNAPTFTVDRGFTGVATAYLDTGFNPSTAGSPKFTQNDATIFAWSRSDIDAATAIFGPATATASGESMMFPRDAGSFRYYVNQGSASSVANTVGSGLFTVTRRGASATEAYRNAISLGAGSIASVAPVSQNFAFLKRGAAGAFWLGECAGGGFGSQLSAAEVTALYNALQAYMTGVGA